MGNGAYGLIVSQARNGTAIDDLEEASFGSGCGIRSLIEYASHLTVALGRAVAVVYAGALFFSRASTDPGRETFPGGKGSGGRADFSNICAESTPKPGTSASRSTAS